VSRSRSIEVVTPEAMEGLGRAIAGGLEGGQTITFSGDLGAGKTTLVRGILRGCGYEGPVKSPTFTLIESYLLDDLTLHHFDLYRLEDPVELEYLAWREYFTDRTVCLVEWPERAAGILPESCLDAIIHKTRQGRTVELVPHNPHGERLAGMMNEKDLL